MSSADKNMAMLYIIAMIFQYQSVSKVCDELEHGEMAIGDAQRDVITHLILHGSYQTGVLQLLTGLPESIIVFIREQYLN